MDGSSKTYPIDVLVSEAEINEIHEIVSRLTRRKLRGRPKTRSELWVDDMAKVLVEHSKAMFVALVIFLLLSWSLERDSIRYGFLVVSVLLSGLQFFSGYIVIRGSFPFFNQLRKYPYDSLLWSIRASVLADNLEIEVLLGFRRIAIERYLVEYLQEKESFEKRGMLLAGALDKIGFFPSLAAFVGVATSLWAHSEFLIRGLVFLVPAFYFVGFGASVLLQEMNRVVAVLEHCIAVLRERGEHVTDSGPIDVSCQEHRASSV
ncbi:hypothetical protein [Burkholderia gladioli]|uniref:hypothetical protein n=1 Tax=Burkholderia gladioli TaxID=28095 RepID=UPI00163FABD5|nr:hypothetical protein [Burkholderia gladioli]MDN7718468.1 hypothetical protein [Burkholderia gladioli]